MERVGALINKLQEQCAQGAEASYILMTAQMLIAELQEQPLEVTNSKKISVVLPFTSNTQAINADKPDQVEEKVEKKNLNLNEDKVIENRPVAITEWLANDPVTAIIPTLTYSDVQSPKKGVSELNAIMHSTEESLNEKLRIEKIELGSVISDPVKDLRKAIGVNDRYRFINELFKGDETMYERSIKTINTFTIYPEAEYWIKRELKLKLVWNEESEMVQQFDQLIRRRFS